MRVQYLNTEHTIYSVALAKMQGRTKLFVRQKQYLYNRRVHLLFELEWKVLVFWKPLRDYKTLLFYVCVIERPKLPLPSHRHTS